MPSTLPEPPTPANPWPARLEPLRRFLPGRRVIFAIKALVLVSLVAYVLTLIRKDNLIEVVSRVSGIHVFGAGLVMAAEWVIHAWKHKVILARAGSGITLGKLLWLNLRIFAISLFLPGEVLGGGARLVLMRNHLTVEQCLFLMIYDRYTQMALTLLFGTVLALTLSDSLTLTAAFAFSSVAMAGAPLILFHPGLAARFQRLLPASWGPKARETLSRLNVGFSWNADTLGVLGISAVLQVLKGLLLWMLCFALDISIGFPVILLYLSVIILVQHVAISFGGLGVREVTTVGFLGLYGVEPEKALVLSLLVYFLHLVKALLGGLAGLAGERVAAPAARAEAAR